MLDEKKLIEIVTQEIIKIIQKDNSITEDEHKRSISSHEQFFSNPRALLAMKEATLARIGVGKAGSRIPTKAMLNLRKDHAAAKDAVLKYVDEELLKRLKLPIYITKCETIEQHLTRPDLGRQLREEDCQKIQNACISSPQIQIYVSDGLSNEAINANVEDILPAMMDQLKFMGFKIGTPFFLKYGRVPAMDEISMLLGAEVTCVLIGERPGLGVVGSMSAYITYKAYKGIPESNRTVISNIYKDGIPPAEAGAYAAEVIAKVMKEGKSGVSLKL